jgi:hypothetical protein
MTGSEQVLSDPRVTMALRVALGSYVIYMGRNLYKDPGSYFASSARWVLGYKWVRMLLRALACFCIWGGCFILATVIAVQIFNLHGGNLAVELPVYAVIAAWLLLPGNSTARAGRR